jgi:hypothetical protein
LTVVVVLPTPPFWLGKHATGQGDSLARVVGHCAGERGVLVVIGEATNKHLPLSFT